MTATYDVFLSHNSADEAAVELVAAQLRDEAGVRPFLDKWALVPGESWIPGLERAIEGSGAVAVFFGPEGVGRWHDEEKQLALLCEKRVIPVLLPGARRNDVVGFLRLRTWVDLDQGDGFARLVAGIKGQAPELLLDLDVERLREAVRQGLPPKVASTRLPHNATKLFGRETELERLDALWTASGAGKANVVTLVAWGGVGKTSLVVEWMNRLAAEGWRGARAVFDWSFYSQGVREQACAATEPGGWRWGLLEDGSDACAEEWFVVAECFDGLTCEQHLSFFRKETAAYPPGYPCTDEIEARDHCFYSTPSLDNPDGCR